MIIKKMGITEILRRIWLFSVNKIKSSESAAAAIVDSTVASVATAHVYVVTDSCKLRSKIRLNPTSYFE